MQLFQLRKSPANFNLLENLTNVEMKKQSFQNVFEACMSNTLWLNADLTTGVINVLYICTQGKSITLY